MVPWHVISGADPKQCRELFAHAIEQGLREGNQRKDLALPVSRPSANAKAKALRHVNRTASLSKEKSEKALLLLQGRLNKVTRTPAFQHRAIVVVFEGPDAAGKGGAIRRITSGLDARRYHVVPVAAPTEEERAYPYLWRFWKEVPKRGTLTIFDRSWYGRVLVERVEQLATENEWKRSYQEIIDFEQELEDSGIMVVKFWLSITRNEQMKRFKERQETSFKQFKISKDDFRNRDKWQAYEAAADAMFRYTSTKSAPWTIVGANDKHYARVTVLKAIVRKLESAIH
jgi:AMP-polyphosphate phosphotransferase